jgi:hypothetical protein
VLLFSSSFPARTVAHEKIMRFQYGLSNIEHAAQGKDDGSIYLCTVQIIHCIFTFFD